MRIVPKLIIIFIFPSLLFAKREHPERWYQKKWCEEQKGKVEVVLPDGTRSDCVTDTHAIEFDFGLPDSCTSWRFSHKEWGQGLICDYSELTWGRTTISNWELWFYVANRPIFRP